MRRIGRRYTGQRLEIWDLGFGIYLMSLKELHRALVLFGRRAAAERAEIAPPTGLRILLAG